MKNNETGDRYLLVKNGESYPSMIILQWSKTGGCTAFNAFSDIVLGRATGYGYDKASTALAEACRKITGDDIKGDGAGIEVVQRSCKEYGHTLYAWCELLGLVIEKHTRSHTYPIVTSALRNNAEKTRNLVYGSNNTAITNEGVAMAHFIDTRMQSSDIINSLKEIC